MASKDKSKVKGLGKDPSLCRLGQRMITTMLREERVAERDLQEKLKAISAKEHKTMVKLGCDSLEVRHDLTRHRSSSPVPGGELKDALDIPSERVNNKGRESPVNLARPSLQGRRAVSMINYSIKQENVVLTSEDRRVNNSDMTRSTLKPSPPQSPTILVENHVEISSKESNKETCDQSLSFQMDRVKSLSLEKLASNDSKLAALPDGKGLSSQRLLRRRPVSDISSSSFSQSSNSSEVNAEFVEQITLDKGMCASNVLDLQRVPQRPSTPPPARRSQTTLSADSRKQRPSSARITRPKSPVGASQETVRGRDRIRLELPQGLTPTRSRSPSPSPSPSRLSPEPPSNYNLGRRGSVPPRINVNTLSASSPLRKGLGASDVTQGLSPASPDALRRRLSANEEDLQDRVQGFLKTLEKK